jgi:hypothetical protein
MDSAFRSAIPDLSLAAIAQLNENSRLGLATKDTALHQGIAWSKSTLALGLPEWSEKTASGPADAANNGTPQTPKQKQQQCLTNFYNSKLGTAVKFGSPLALLPGWNPQWGENAGEWAVAIFGKGGGLFGSGAVTGTTQLTTLSGTTTVGSALELGTEAVLGGIEKAAWPAAAVATLVDIGAHVNCANIDPSAIPEGPIP